MKKSLFLLFFILSAVRISGQVPQHVDSLKRLLFGTREDTVKVMTLVNLSFFDQSYQHGLDLAEEALSLARKIKYKKGEAESLHQVANQCLDASNYPMALDYYLQSLKIKEAINDRSGMGRTLSGIGMIYLHQGDFVNSIHYMHQAESLLHGNYYRLAYVYSNMGIVYARQAKLDSALKYYQLSYEYFNLSKEKYQLNLALDGLGVLQLKMGNTDLALGYFREAIRNGKSNNDTLGLSESYLRIAELYHSHESIDSSLFYANRALFYAQRANMLQNISESGSLLSKIYQGGNDKEALHFLQISKSAEDSIYNREKTIKIQNMLFNEKERESEIAERQKKEAEVRKLNIQYALIAFGIISFIILFFLLSRSIIVNEKWISFFGVLGLLVALEFVNLLIHPSLAAITHESPLLMLLALVCLASVLIPLHHRLEKWIREKMTEKNRRIRLANARKTIEQLGGKEEIQ